MNDFAFAYRDLILFLFKPVFKGRLTVKEVEGSTPSTQGKDKSTSAVGIP
jgi:hypothetical protein